MTLAPRIQLHLAVAAIAVLAACAVPEAASAVPASWSPTLPPHVPSATETDSCAMCHRGHSASSDATWTSSVAPETSHSALLLGTAGRGDIPLCYTCHGVDTLGATSDVQSAFESLSAHSLDPTASAYGPPVKRCGSCHDSHGTARIATGTPYPALLRAAAGAGTLVFQGDAFCASCHTARAGNSFPGLSGWSLTAHARIARPASGTSIVCSSCHEPHGSSIAPLIRSVLETPAVSVATTVTANDRSFCLACHASAYGTWESSAAYVGSHASSAATVPVTGEWAASGAARRVGECQACHAAMGASDGAGGVVPKLARLSGRALCDTCHRAGGAATTDFASLAYSPTTPGAELLALWPATTSTSAYGRLGIYARESAAAATPVGPREVRTLGSAAALAVGDIDGDGVREALASDGTQSRLVRARGDLKRGLGTAYLSLPLPASPAVLLAVGDVFTDASGLPEIVTVDAAGNVDVLRYSGGVLVRVATAAVTGSATSIAVGDVVGSAAADIVITTSGPDGLWILTESGALLDAGGSPYATRANPVGVAIGDAQPGGAKLEITVANAGEATNVVSIFNGAGTELVAGGGALPAGSATAVLVGDVLPGVTPGGTSGDEIAVAYGGGAAGSGVRVLEQASGAFGPALDYSTGAGTNASALALGDANGDGRADLAVACAGRYTRTSSSVEPAVEVFSANGAGTALSAAFELPGGGTELAGGAPAVAIADIGAVPPSRHPASVTPGAHNSTETVPALRHVECSDCHDSHRASVAASSTTWLPGQLIGAWGVKPLNTSAVGVVFSARAEASAEYEVCFACHSTADPTSSRSIASEVNTLAASFHPVEESRVTTHTLGSVLTGVASGETIRCDACHGRSSASGPRGPHVSPSAPLLKRGYFGTRVGDTTSLCYACHPASIYLTGAGDASGGNRSGFFDTAGANPKLHSYHASLGLGCESCHQSHGSTLLPALLRSGPFTWSDQPSGGACQADCHTGGATHTYAR